MPASQEATVPEMDKSPLTDERSRASCDREVPQTDTLVREDSLDCILIGFLNDCAHTNGAITAQLHSTNWANRSAVGRVPDYRAGGGGFKPRTNTQGL